MEPRAVIVRPAPAEPRPWESAAGGAAAVVFEHPPSDDTRAFLEKAGCALLDGTIADPVGLARSVHVLDPSLQVVLVAPAAERTRLERALLFAPGLGEIWIVAPEEVGTGLIERAAGVTRQRRSFRTLHARLEHDLATLEPHPARRAVISDAYLAALLGALPDPVMSLDEEGRILTWNPAAELVLGHTREAVIGNTLDEIFALENPEVLAAITVNGDAPAESEIRFRRRDGVAGIAEIAVVPVEAAGHRVRAVVLHDVTDERRARVEAERARRSADEANRAKSQFLANMSHELRTPINAIVGYADLLEMGVAGSLTDRQQAYVERLKSGGQHLIGLVNEILDLAKMEAGELTVARQPAAIRATAKAALALLAPQAQTKSIEVVEEPVAASDTLYLGDEDRVRQILVNLLSNAVKFTEPGGRVTLRWRTAGEPFEGRNGETGSEAGGELPWVAVEVEDTGIGIAPEQLARVFEPFMQVDDKNTRREGGTGLGLTISRKFARLMGGDLTAWSQPGEGSRFTLWLPASTSEAISRAAGNEPGGIPAAAPVVVIAFGEDEQALAELEQQVHPGVRLLGTTAEEQVLALARRENASLVVLDISREDGAAWRVAQRLHGDPELTDTAVLLLPWIPSGGGGQGSKGFDLGWISLVPKPFTPEQLTRAVSVAALGDEEQVAAGRGTEPGDVLIVDDDADTRRIAGTFLESANVRVREAEDGQQALAEMRRSAPDVVVLDLMMPVLDGFGVLDAMRRDPALARIPVVVLTAKSLTEAERQFLASTAVKIFEKGSHHLADVAALVVRAAAQTRRHTRPPAAKS